MLKIADIELTITDLETEMANGRIYEATLITDDGAHLHGIYDPDVKSITIDPRVPTVETLIHELIHRARPKWSEAKVKREEKRMMGLLSPRDVQTWYRRYKRAVRKRRPVDAIEYEE
jgi:hypothetical protein